jgi:arylsulfatase A-like enzyme
MLTALDEAVGRVLRKLPEGTLVFFLSDNGGPTRQTSSRNGILHGFKGQVLEGGIRVPFFLQWRGRIQPGTLSHQPVISLDVLPTALAAAGARLPAALDGENLLPLPKQPGKRTLYWRFGLQSAIRDDQWKLARIAGEPPRLYHLADDPGESNDMAAREPATVKRLLARYDAWNRELVEPGWRTEQRLRRNRRF